jgi:hypothetical protein
MTREVVLLHHHREYLEDRKCRHYLISWSVVERMHGKSTAKIYLLLEITQKPLLLSPRCVRMLADVHISTQKRHIDKLVDNQALNLRQGDHVGILDNKAAALCAAGDLDSALSDGRQMIKAAKNDPRV